MYVMVKTKVGEWLERQFLGWQTQEGERKTVGAFADWLGVSRVLLSRWMNSQSNPDKSSADKIALRLGNDIYKLLGLDEPDEGLQTINKLWGTLPESIKNDLIRRAENGSTSNLSKTTVAQLKQKQKA